MKTKTNAKPHTQPKPSVPHEDFLNNYVEYADIFESPPDAHLAVAMSLIAATVNGNVWIQNGGQRVTLDTWTLLLSGSGVGRNTLLTMARPVVQGADMESLIRNTSWGSKQAFYQDLAERHKGLFIWEELSASLKALSDPRFAEAKKWLTNIYDNEGIPQALIYRKNGSSSKNTEPIVFTQAPRTNILATSSKEWFVNSITHEDSMGGFVPRWFLVDMPDLGRSIPVPNEPDASLIEPLTERLIAVKDLAGPVDLSRVRSLYEDWYRAAQQRFDSQPNKSLAKAYWNRHRVHLLKLAAILSISEACSLSVAPDSMDRAIKMAATAESTIFELLPTGMSHEGAEIDKVARAILGAGPKGMLRSEFTGTFQYIPEHLRESRLRTLVDAGTITVFRRSGAGRPAEVFVHKQHLECHKEAHLQDTEI